MLTFTSSDTCEFAEGPIASVAIPDGFEHSTASHARNTVWISPAGTQGSGMVVFAYSLKHEEVANARRGDAYRDFSAGDRTWRLNTDPDDPADLRAILILNDAAIAVIATNFGWNDDHLRRFLSRIAIRNES